MRPAATVSCPACGRSWPARTSRFCGRCGESLAVAPSPDRRRPSRAALVAGGVGLAALTLVGVAVTVTQVTGAIAARPQAEVDLPEAEDLTPRRGLTGEEARAALAPFDPDRLRCEPDGCERWTVDLPGGIDQATRLGDLLVLQIDHRLLAIDVDTGDRRWTASLDGPDGQPARRGVNESRIMTANDDHLAVARESGDLRVLDRHGRHRWSSPPPAPSWLWAVRVIGDVVITVGPPPSPADGSSALHAFDAHDGALLWSKVVDDLPAGSDDTVFVRTQEDGFVRLDPTTGEAMVSYPDAIWANPVGDRLLVLGDDSGTRTWVADAETGERHLDLDGYLETSIVEGDTAYLQVVNDDRQAEREIVALGLDGGERWRRTIELDLTSTCCPALAVTADGALYVDDPAGAGRVLDARSGRDRPHRDPPPIPPGEWWTGRVAIDHGPGGELTLTSTTGSARVPTGNAWLLLDDPVVLASREGLIGVELVPSPVGPRPPTRLPAS